MSNPVSLGSFHPEEHGAYYISLMAQGNTLLFEKSNHLVGKAMKWLDDAGKEAEYEVAAGIDLNLIGVLIIRPKSKEQPNREFSKGLEESKLAKMKSKFGPK